MMDDPSTQTHFQPSSHHDMTFGTQKRHDVNIMRLIAHRCGSFITYFSIERVDWLVTQGLLVVKLALRAS